MAHTTMELGLRYLKLVLRLRRIAPSFVDSYTGPAELAAEVDSEAPPAPLKLRGQAQALQRVVREHEADVERRAWLEAQLGGIASAIGRMAGEACSYRELVARCHGVTPTLVPEAAFAAAHRDLDEVLPGRGDVRRRYQRWAATQVVAADLLEPGLAALADELRSRCRGCFGLPVGEKVGFEVVNDEPWLGYADYLGALRTHIRINRDLPIPSFRLLDLVAHEAYPGHHTEHACKEALVAGGRHELGVWVYCTPQALLSEGIACNSMEMVPADDIDDAVASRLRPVGIPYDPPVAAVARQVKGALLAVRANIALMLDEGRLTSAQAYEYARQWSLEDDAHVKRSLKTLQAQPWRPYESCYSEGRELIGRWVSGDRTRFRRLLHEQLTPARLQDPGATACGPDEGEQRSV